VSSETISEFIAALDLGSNSFHMIVARHNDGQLQTIDKLKDNVRLASGLDKHGNLDKKSTRRALEALDRFGQRLREIPTESVRVVGTNTFRRIDKNSGFFEKAEETLGHRIDIIRGREEARLVFLGVAHSLENSEDKRLVIDIGGGSTELIIGEKFRPTQLESLYMGCVSMSQKHFAEGKVTNSRMKKAELDALQHLESVSKQYKRASWDIAVGASGTILAVQEVINQQGWSKKGITRYALDELKEALCHSDQKLKGLQEDRALVFPGGVAILCALFKRFNIDSMEVSSGALREGLLYDLIGRHKANDIRYTSVRDLAERFQIDADQAESVKSTVLQFLKQSDKTWSLNGSRNRQLLSWAATLHEIGMNISHRQYHKHGEYLTANMDIPGFSNQDQKQLSLLVRSHRRKLDPELFDELPRKQKAILIRLAILLRLAIILHRDRSSLPIELPKLHCTENSIKLKFPENWFDDHPLTSLDLEQETQFLSEIPFEIKLAYALGLL